MMKRIYLFMLVLVAALAVHGDVAVQSMSLQPTDLTAVQMGRTDLTGAPCAVVRVVLPRDGVTFEGNVIGAPVFTGSEWHVALTEGTKQMKISVPGSAPVMVTFADYGIPPLQGKATYQLVLSDVSGTYTGTIYFSPATAAVVVDSENIATSNGVATVSRPAGSYAFSVSAPGYQTKTGILTIAASGRNEVDVLLRPEQGGAPAPAAVTQPDPYNGYEYVDLGLPSGLKWATCNVGAEKPTDYGDYFAWGEISTKDTYTVENSKTFKKKGLIEIDLAGNPEYDAARANWGGAWRMPTKEEFEELLANCTYNWMTIDGVKCGVFTSKLNSRELILPAAGWRDGKKSYHHKGGSGYYWSASPSIDTKYSWDLFIRITGSYVNLNQHYNGHPVRPVAE